MAFGYLPAIKKYNEEAQVFNTTAAVTKFMFENLMLDTGSYFAEWVSAFVLALANACLAGIELFLIICGPWLIYTDKYRATIDD